MLKQFKNKYGKSSDFIPEIDSIFEKTCLILVIKAYNLMKTDNKYQIYWKETQFSALLIGYMRQIRVVEDLGLRIDPENYLYDEDILNGTKDPDTASRIDIKICGAWINEDIYYGIEAKILIESPFLSKEPDELRKRYIETGIDNFIKKKYSAEMEKACIIGYVIQGNCQNIVDYINIKILNLNRSNEILQGKKTIENHSNCWTSKHVKTDSSNIDICHIMLQM